MTTAREMIKAIIGRNKAEQSMLLILQKQTECLVIIFAFYLRLVDHLNRNDQN